MAYTNSPLVSYTKISPNRTQNRNHAIDTITIHCVVGQCTVQALGAVFAPATRQASSNYGIGYDGKIGMYCEEKDRSWCTSSAANDHRAITIEVASDTSHPYKVNEKAYAALIDLCADICKRNNIKELKWQADKSLVGQVDKQNMTVHRWFANTACPGEYLYNLHGQIAADVNARLGVAVSKPTAASIKAGDVVQITGTKYYGGQAVPSWVKSKKWIVHSVSGDRVVLNKSEDGASSIMSPFKKSDVALAVTKAPEPVAPASKPATQPSVNPPSTASFKPGDIVKIVGTKYYGGQTVPSWVKAKRWIVHSTVGDSVVVDKSEDGKSSIMSPFKKGDIALVTKQEATASSNQSAPTTPAKPATTVSFKSGDVVKITGTKYYGGQAVPSWVKAKKWIVHSISGDRVVLDKSADGKSSIMSAFKKSDISF